MTESELETWFASEPDPKTKAMIEFFMNEDTKLHTMDPTLTNSYGQEPLESHGCYNQRIMEHCRPEHDYRRQQFTHSVLHPSPACSVIPWMSP